MWKTPERVTCCCCKSKSTKTLFKPCDICIDRLMPENSLLYWSYFVTFPNMEKHSHLICPIRNAYVLYYQKFHLHVLKEAINCACDRGLFLLYHHWGHAWRFLGSYTANYVLWEITRLASYVLRGFFVAIFSIQLRAANSWPLIFTLNGSDWLVKSFKHLSFCCCRGCTGNIGS